MSAVEQRETLSALQCANNYPQGEKSLRGGVERRGRDSNPEAREGAGFRDRCIAVLPPLRVVTTLPCAGVADAGR